MKHISLFLLMGFMVPAWGATPEASGGGEVNGPALPGHSMMGDAFDEGPRQAAWLFEGNGKVDFPITTKDPLAAKFFTQGVGQLHGFWYFEAERSFRQAAAIDPTCAMAFWGMAMANINNEKRAAEFAQKAAGLKDKVSRREQLWIAGWEEFFKDTKGEDKAKREKLVKAMEALIFEFPEDLEAKAFLVFLIWENRNHGIAIPSRTAVDALGQQVLAVNPMHPGVNHYLIHLWNVENLNDRALPSARVCGQSAPGIAHMWHMPGHTFSSLKRYSDAVWQQEASARVDHAQMMARRVLPDQIHNFAHNNAWLVRDLCLVGRVHDAVGLALNMVELPRLSKSSAASYSLGRDELLNALLAFELWDQVLELEGSLPPFENPLDEVRRLSLIGLAAVGKGDLKKAQLQIDALEKSLEGARQERFKEAEKAEEVAKKENKGEATIATAIGTAMRRFSRRMEVTRAAVAEIRVVWALHENNLEQAKKEMKETLGIASPRLSALKFALGEKEEALKVARDAVKADDQKVLPLANLADLLWRAGKKEEALETFQKLRKLSAALDLDVPAFARLSPLAQELKLPEDWRQAGPAVDVGVRPELAKLGPLHWSPSAAAPWTLPVDKGGSLSLADFQGRPVLLLFYLGKGCSHCLQQLNTFAPMAKAYAEAGISLVAVSTDSIDGLRGTFAEVFEKSGTPGEGSFPIVSDADLNTFKAYGAFDDFEQIALHGTFLVDGKGAVRWQNIGKAPFEDATWLLEECKRLLKVPSAVGGSREKSVAGGR